MWRQLLCVSGKAATQMKWLLLIRTPRDVATNHGPDFTIFGKSGPIWLKPSSKLLSIGIRVLKNRIPIFNSFEEGYAVLSVAAAEVWNVWQCRVRIICRLVLALTEYISVPAIIPLFAPKITLKLSLYVYALITTLIPTPGDGRLSWPSCLTHSGQWSSVNHRSGSGQRNSADQRQIS